MNTILLFLKDFVVLFIIVLIVYFVFLNKKRKDYSKLKQNDEIKLFIARYNLDMKKTKYKTVLNTVTIINSFIIAFSATIIGFIDNIIWSILVGFVILLVLIYSLYEIFGRLLKRREDK